MTSVDGAVPPRLRIVTRPPPRRPVVPSVVFATLVFIFTEVMFFTGLISAHSITRAGWPIWPPPGQPRLPLEATAVTTAALLTSGVLLFLAWRARKRGGKGLALLASAMGLGAFFVVAQGYEWAAMLRQGLTLTSSNHGAFFYLIVGAHALHVVAGLAVLAWIAIGAARARISEDTFLAGSLYWYFVVGLWPALYLRVYL